MKIIKESEAEMFQNGVNCTVREYDFHDPKIDLGICEITGRYPEKGRCYNKECKEMVYVISGSGNLYLKDTIYSFESEDTFLIEPFEEYYYDGNCKLALICSPAFQRENHVIVEEN